MEPIALRKLMLRNTSIDSDVTIRMWPPIEYHAGFVCDYEIDGLPVPVRSHGTGINSLGALTHALSLIHIALEPYRGTLSWLGEFGDHGVPYLIDAIDTSEQRRLEVLVKTQIDEFFSSHARSSRASEQTAKSLYQHGMPTVDGSTAPGSIVDYLRNIVEREKQLQASSDTQEAYAMQEYRWTLIKELKRRPECSAILRQLTSDAEPTLRLLAAQLLFPEPPAVRTLEELIFLAKEPYASEASLFLESMLRDLSRPKSWET